MDNLLWEKKIQRIHVSDPSRGKIEKSECKEPDRPQLRQVKTTGKKNKKKQAQEKKKKTRITLTRGNENLVGGTR